MRSPSLILAVFLAFSVSATVSAQEVDAAAVLAKVDAVATQAKDFTARVELETAEAKGRTTKRTFTVWQKGTDQRMLKLSKPARLKGVGMLATDAEQLYMYLPSFGRVRRVAGRKRGEPFLGSNFTRDDMVRTRYAPRFVPKFVEQDEETWVLRLDPIKPADEPHHHLVIRVRKADSLVAQIEFFEADGGKPSRRLVASDVREVGKIPFAHKIEAKDLEHGSTSTAVLHDIKVDGGIDDEFFSKRHLTRKP